MGAQQSASRDGSAPGAEALKKCYYEVLGIERHATDDEIKKAYRRKALELHPDRNYGDVENATAKFAEVQSAYEVLSDPQERSWYDSHRDSILRGDDGPAEDHFQHNVRLTSAGDIVGLISRFNSSIPFTDAQNGFYGILQETFSTLAKEEDMACDWEGFEPVEYPTFGRAEDNYEDVVRPFYRVWMNFFTKKTFSWRDAYRPADAPDRATRRLMEKENKRFREEGIREFNDAVRSLVVFVRRRDPRYIPNSQTEADRQKILRDAAAAQAARSRAANQAKLKEHIIPSWAQSQIPEDILSVSESEESEVEHIECVVCGKTFKSEKQYETHEKSKKHIKAVQQLQREMRKENELLELNTPPNDEPGAPISGFDELSLQKAASSEADRPPPEIEKDPAGVGLAPGKYSYHDPLSIADDQSDSSEADDEYASRKEVEERIKHSLAKKLASDDPNDSTATASVASDEWGQRKVGKAKAKRAKKAARQEKENQEGQEFQCAACNETFASKTKLFNHINELNHAQPVAKATRGKNKRR